MSRLAFTVPGPPVAWPRREGDSIPRVVRVYRRYVLGYAHAALRLAAVGDSSPNGVALTLGFHHRSDVPVEIDDYACVALDALRGVFHDQQRQVREFLVSLHTAKPGQERLEVEVRFGEATEGPSLEAPDPDGWRARALAAEAALIPYASLGRAANVPTTDDARLVARACSTLGITRTALAARVGCSPSVLSRANDRPMAAHHRTNIERILAARD